MTRETPPVSDATTEEGAISGNRWEGETHLGLMVVGCPGDPARIGEVALLPEGRRFILSRGSEVADQLTFGRLRPGLWEAGGPWTLRQMSRRQLSVWADSGSVRVEQLGRGELRVAGQPTLVGRAQVGDLVAVDRHLLLRCVARPSTLPIPKLFPRALIPGYALADVGGFVGESPDAWKLRDAAALAAAQSNPVVVIGEPGYGKRALARLILALRKPDGCVVWDAGAQIEAHALESLFGSLEHAGALAGAARGTLWISHAEKLSEPVSSALVAWLSSAGTYRTSGGAAEVRSDARLLLSSTPNPPQHVMDLLERAPLSIEVDSCADPGDRALVLHHLARGLVQESGAAVEAWCDVGGDLRLPVEVCESALRSHQGGYQLQRALWSSLGGPPPRERELGAGQAARRPGAWLARDHFDSAVRDALRSFLDLQRLSGSPLLGSRVVRAGGPYTDPALAVRFLREHLLRTATELPDPRDTELLQASYFAPKTKQIAVAAELGLAYSTYRRQLKLVVERFCEQLWLREVEAE